jgi:molybdopterin adenylyltransferase
MNPVLARPDLRAHHFTPAQPCPHLLFVAGPGRTVTGMGRDDHQQASPRQVQAAVLTISDTRTPETDESGNYLRRELLNAGHEVMASELVRDDAALIRPALARLMASSQVVITTGGTGIAGRDVTIPVVESLITKPMPGFGELFRMLSYPQVGAAAMLSRAVGGLAGDTLIFALPGSLNAVQTGWEGLLKGELGHFVFEMTRHTQA